MGEEGEEGEEGEKQHGRDEELVGGDDKREMTGKVWADTATPIRHRHLRAPGFINLYGCGYRSCHGEELVKADAELHIRRCLGQEKVCA
jgi:hypothetical protein